MPLFHGNALMALWGPSVIVGVGHRRPAPFQRIVLPRRRPPLRGHQVQLRRQGHRLHPGHPRTARRRREHAHERLRDRGLGPRPQPLPEAVRLLLIEGYGQSEGGAAINPTAGMPKGALGGPVDGVDLAVISPETGEQCPPARFDAERRLLNAGEAIGEIVNRSGRGKFEGYYKREDAEHERLRERLVLDGRPGLRRRERLLLLRRPQRRLAAGRLGELRRRAGRGGALAQPRPGRGGGLPRPRHGLGRGRPGHGRRRDWPRTPPSIPRRSPTWLEDQPDLGPQVDPPLCPGVGLPTPDGDGQGDQGRPAPGGLGLRRTGVVAAARHARSSGFEVLGDDDRPSWLPVWPRTADRRSDAAS